MTLSDNFRKIDGIESVQYDKAILIRIHGILNRIMTAFSIIGIGIVVISIILVSNTTRLMIHSKKESINILSLMGASNFFIRIPFLIEGIFQGLIGAMISIILLFSLNIITGLRLARASSITWEYPSVNEGKIKML